MEGLPSGLIRCFSATLALMPEKIFLGGFSQ